jgi:FdhD protein
LSRGAVEPVEEQVYAVTLSGTPVAALTASACDPVELAAGHLLGRGHPWDALSAAAFRVDDGAVDVDLTPEAADAGACLRAHRTSQGVAHVLGCGDCRALLGAGDAPLPAPDELRALMGELYGESSGVHAAGLVRGTELIIRLEDVARHAALDRLAGAALRRGWDPAGLGLVTTARISGEMAYKAARAGLAWVASRSVPTTLAARIAAAAELPIVARAGTPRQRMFAGVLAS